MEQFIQYTLYLHMLVGGLSLLTGALAIFSAKGKSTHILAGKMYFLAMTLVFITGLIVASYRDNKFLFLIAFLSYYSVFCGVRSLKLKKLHLGQLPKWYDWGAGIVNGIANFIFLLFGLYHWLFTDIPFGGVILSIGFGIGGLILTYTNLHPFVKRPEKPYHWYLSHIGNMMGGYIATLTAFLAVMVSRYGFMNPFLAFALPSLIGVPFLIFQQKQIEKKFQKSHNS